MKKKKSSSTIKSPLPIFQLFLGVIFEIWSFFQTLVLELGGRKSNLSARYSAHTYSLRFMLKLAIAITKYSYNFVFNANGTAVGITNSTTRTVEPIGMDQIIINADVKDKDCVTAIGTCSREKTYPFIIITKGTTERSCSKIKIRGDT